VSQNSAEDKQFGTVDESRNAFRLCINRADQSLMLKADIWPEDIIIKRWYFRKKESDSNDDGGERRTASDDDGIESHSSSSSSSISNQLLKPATMQKKLTWTKQL